MHEDLTEQNTQPLAVLKAMKSAADLQQFLRRYQLEPLHVARACRVRYLMIWKLQQGQPIGRANSLLVRQGLERLTGVAYTAPIWMGEESEAQETLPSGKQEHESTKGEILQDEEPLQRTWKDFSGKTSPFFSDTRSCHTCLSRGRKQT
jgi:hypothetical protein